MDRLIARLVLAAIAAAILVATAAFIAVPRALAQGNAPGTVTVSWAITGIDQFSADLDQAGNARWNSVMLNAGVTRQFIPAFWAGISMRDDDEDWRFHSASAFGAKPPWEHLHRAGTSANLNLALSPTLVVGVSPTLDWAYATGADMGDALTYGAVMSVVKVWSPKFVLGGGASVTRQFYSVKTSPFVIVNWKLTDKLKIANAVSGSPLGGAGVELRYALTPDWELAGGGVSRSDRWRLAKPVAGKADVGETSCIPLLARFSRKLGARARFDLHAGVLVGNKLRVRDSDGHEIAHDDYRTAPVISATLSGKF